MTFWELAELSEEHVPYGSVDSARVVELHAVLGDYPAEELPFLSPVNAVVPSLLETLAGAPELISASDLDRARREWAALEPVLGSRDGFEARRRGLRPLDPAVLQVMTAARMLQLVAALALVPELPLLAEGLQPALEAWRAMPFAGGIE